MTIKDIEARSGMTRANIRFYETEGLLTPARSANGYRDYSDHDLEVLKRIKLLRSLRIPLEEIKALHNDTDDLLHTLDRHIAALNAERQDIDRSEQVCREMRTDGVTYQTLDAQKYLDALDRGAEEIALSADVIPAVRAPWRRFFARLLDFWLYSLAADAFLLLVCHLSPARQNSGFGLLSILLALLLMLFAEPLLLHLRGTTPGKWIMGLSVVSDSDRRLSYGDGFVRTVGVLRYGLGWSLPIYRLIRLWKSYKACDENRDLPWEDGSVLALRQRKRWFAPVLACVYAAALFGVLLLCVPLAEAPRYRGDITAAEFCGNVNRMAAYQGLELGGTWDETGQWQADRYPNVIHMGAQVDPPDFTITETDGVVTRVAFQYASYKPEYWPPSFQDQMILSAFSYAGVQEGLFGYLNTRDTILSEIQAHSYESFSFTENGVTLTCNVAYSGYDPQGAEYLWPTDDQNASYTFSFCMEKTA